MGMKGMSDEGRSVGNRSSKRGAAGKRENDKCGKVCGKITKKNEEGIRKLKLLFLSA